MLKARHHAALKAFAAAAPKLPIGGSVPLKAVAASAAAAAAATASAAASRKSKGPFLAENPQEAEDEPCCAHCQLPLGELAEEGPAGKRLHAECAAELLLRTAWAEEEADRLSAAKAKHACRAKFGIGWSPKAVTPNHGPAAAMGCVLNGCSPGLCSVVLHESSDNKYWACLAPCRDPIASVNLEYLTLAMQTLKLDGRAPFFSLEPVPSADAAPWEEWLQAKMFQPAWFEGTSAGEVMFQADVYLKELSMGEHPQPVVGMRSCMDMCQDDGDEEDWTAREWFVIRKAGLRVAQDGSLLPEVSMAVQARETLRRHDGSLEDAPVTRPDHPLLKYAADFTHNFDLIAERMSVVHHLRELARATVLATFLVENKVPLKVPELWKAKARLLGPREIPQLWNVRAHSELRSGEGAGEKAPSVHRQVLQVYGGVSLAFDAGEVIRPPGGLRPHRRAPPLHMGTPIAIPELPPPEVVPDRGPLAAVIKADLVDIRSVSLGSLPQTRLMLMQRILQAKGVEPKLDIRGARMDYARLREQKLSSGLSLTARASDRLDPLLRHSLKARGTFRLNQAAPIPRLKSNLTRGSDGPVGDFSLPTTPAKGVDLRIGAGGVPALGELEVELAASNRSLEYGSDFWQSISPSSGPILSPNEKEFFQALYDPHLSDRRMERERFAPPSRRRHAYLSKLKQLLKEEGEARQRRLKHFRSTAFSIEDPGPLFPASWATRGHGQGRAGRRKAELHERPEYPKRQLQELLQRAALAFEKRSEDGTTFRVYKVGKLEIRATEEPGAAETPVAFFSSLPPPSAVQSKAGRVADYEPLLKVTKYVHWPQEAKWPQFFVVFETPAGHVLSEMLPAQTAPLWLENHEFLEERLAGAKALCCAHYDGSGLRLGVTKAFRTSAARTFKHLNPGEANRRYADGLFNAISGTTAKAPGN